MVPFAHPTSAGGATNLDPRIQSIAPDGLLRGKYRLIEQLGEGAHGVSYLAQHEYLSHPCVVKLLPPRHGAAPDAVERLRGEARAGFRVQDPGVVRVLDCDVVRGAWYFVMEYIDGVNLAMILEHESRLTWQQGVQIGLDAAAGLGAIHRAGLLHRDVKPGNLILGTDGHTRIADLGVAGVVSEPRELGRFGGPAMAGTLLYTAPEMFRPAAVVGPQADLYALGATLYHLLLGRPPHGGDRVFQHLIDMQCRPAVWPADAPRDVPAWLAELVLGLLSTEPQGRPNSAEELAARLSRRAQPAGEVRAPVAADELRPRGIGVLPLRNSGPSTADDWLGYAVANYLSRALAETPGVYVVDQDRLMELTGPTARDPGGPGVAALLEAGRLIGAGTLVLGRFTRDGGRLEVDVELLSAERAEPASVAQAVGELTNLPDLERTLYERVAAALRVEQRGAGRTPEPGLEAREKFVRARQAFLKGEYDRAVILAEESAAAAPTFAEAIGFAGVCLARLGRYDEAEEHHRREERLAHETGEPRGEVEAQANLGAMNYFRGEYEAAEGQYLRAAEQAEQLGLATEHAQICNNVGFVLFRRGRLAEAQRFFLRAIEAHRSYGGLISLIGPYNGLGNVLVEQRQYEGARTYYRRALALAQEIGDRTNVGTTHMHLGRCAALEGRFAEAKHEFTMALNALEETRFWNGLARAYEYVAELHVQLGNYDEAARCADKRIELARQHANVRMEQAAWLQKAECLRRAGRTAEAEQCAARGGTPAAAGT